MIKQASLITGLVVAAAFAAGPVLPTSSADAQDAPAAPETAQLTEKEAQWLKSHNDERAVFGSMPLKWNSQLEADAKAWADNLARRDVMQHASHDVRKGAGENIWVGTRGRYTPHQMIDAFIREKSDFKPGVFPDVTKSGNWQSVGHYTQLVWPETREVGCAIAENRMDEFLVCRYLPAGNFRGVKIGPAPHVEARPHAPAIRVKNES